MAQASAPDVGARKATTLLFDGACHLCSREIAHYRRRNQAGQLAFVDISHPDFDAAMWGVNKTAVNKHMHVRLPDGRYQIGLGAFVAVWEVLPGYGWLAQLAKTPGISTAMRVGYAAFAHMRPWLPKRATAYGSCPRP